MYYCVEKAVEKGRLPFTEALILHPNAPWDARPGHAGKDRVRMWLAALKWLAVLKW
jgi:hypothetical protein